MGTTDKQRVTPSRGYLLVFGLSRGGTNLCAQRLHGLRGVTSLSETTSRLALPGETEPPRGFAADAVVRGTLPPPKSLSEPIDYLCLNKINYALLCHPKDWVERFEHDPRLRAVLLYRNPFEIHRSRCNWVTRYKPQRVRWTDLNQLAREWMELGHIAIRLLATDRAAIVIHERTAADRALLKKQLDSICGHAFSDDHADVPSSCFHCGAKSLNQRKRYDWDPNLWLYCTGCNQFLTGFGDYNFIRDPGHEVATDWRSRQNIDSLVPQMRPWLGDRALEFFLENQHTRDDAESQLTQILQSESSRFLATPLDDILYPY